MSIKLGGGDDAIRLRWSPAPREGDAQDALASQWELESEPDWQRLEGIRLVSARFDDGAALGLAAARPRAARGHGDDVAVARVVDAEGLETATSDALVSVEYDAEGRPRRLGIELWADPDSAPLRVAADRDEASEAPGASGRDAVAMSFRRDGVTGSGLYEVVRPG